MAVRIVRAFAVVALGATAAAANVEHSTKRNLRVSAPSAPAAKADKSAEKVAAKSDAKSVYTIDDTPDPHGSFKCLSVKTSRIPHAGRGLFAACPMGAETLLGEYVGERFMMGQNGANKKLAADWAYIWKVPRCKAPKDQLQVLKRSDKGPAHECSSANGFVYVDAKPLDDEVRNPMRFVNGVEHEDESQQGMVQEGGQPEKANVDVFFEDDRVFYYTSRAVKEGEEFIVDYGAGYWGEHKNSNDVPIASSDDMDGDWGTFVTDF